MATILIVEDEQSLLLLMIDLLEDAGYKVLGAKHGKEALQLIESEKPDLIISDVMMPVMDGLELLCEVKSRKEFAGIKIILVSAVPIKPGQEFQPELYLSKPYDIFLIEEAVETLLSYPH